MRNVTTVLMLVAALAGCTDADIASSNISKAADMFEITRRIVFINGITDRYMLVVEGRCSIRADRADNQLEVTCKHGPDAYKKHYLGLSDNVTYVAEQLEMADVGTYHYRLVFKPQAIVPEIDLRSNTRELLKDRN